MRIKLSGLSLLVCLVSLYTSISLAAPNFRVSIKQRPHHQILSLVGKTMPGDEHVLDEMELLVPGKSVLLEMNFNGGYAGIISQIYQRVHGVCKGYRNCTITTFVPSNGQCASACLELLMAGSARKAGKKSRFGFHTTWIGLPSLMVPVPGHAQKRLASLGVDKHWLTANQNLFSRIEVSWRTPFELTESNLLTEIVD